MAPIARLQWAQSPRHHDRWHGWKHGCENFFSSLIVPRSTTTDRWHLSTHYNCCLSCSGHKPLRSANFLKDCGIVFHCSWFSFHKLLTLKKCWPTCFFLERNFRKLDWCLSIFSWQDLNLSLNVWFSKYDIMIFRFFQFFFFFKQTVEEESTRNYLFSRETNKKRETERERERKRERERERERERDWWAIDLTIWLPNEMKKSGCVSPKTVLETFIFLQNATTRHWFPKLAANFSRNAGMQRYVSTKCRFLPPISYVRTDNFQFLATSTP